MLTILSSFQVLYFLEPIVFSSGLYLEHALPKTIKWPADGKDGVFVSLFDVAVLSRVVTVMVVT